MELVVQIQSSDVVKLAKTTMDGTKKHIELSYIEARCLKKIVDEVTR